MVGRGSMRDRPGAVSLVAVFLFIATMIALVVGTALLFPGTFLDRLWELNKPAHAGFKVLGRASCVLLWLLSIATAAAGTGLLRGKKWAWWLSIAVFAASGLGDLINLWITKDLLKSGSGVLIAGAFLFFLLRPIVTGFLESDAP
jgi:hypothetical protein